MNESETELWPDEDNLLHFSRHFSYVVCVYKTDIVHNYAHAKQKTRNCAKFFDWIVTMFSCQNANTAVRMALLRRDKADFYYLQANGKWARS